jgi:hypothetical protein
VGVLVFTGTGVRVASLSKVGMRVGTGVLGNWVEVRAGVFEGVCMALVTEVAVTRIDVGAVCIDVAPK